MNLTDYLIPAGNDYKPADTQDNLGNTITLYNGAASFELPKDARVAIIGVPEDRFSDGAGEIKSPGQIRKQLYALSAGSPGQVVDMGNLRTGKTLTDTYFALKHVVAELYGHNIVTLVIGGTADVFYGNYLAVEGQKMNLTGITPQLRLPSGEGQHPLNTLIFGQNTHVHFCNIGCQSYYVSQQDLEYFKNQHFEIYRLGEVRAGNLSEPVIRDSDLLILSMNAIRHSDAPAASNPLPNGFSGEEACQLAHYAGLSYRCKSMGIFDMVSQNDIHGITAMLAAQIAWYFIEGVKRRNFDNPKDSVRNFKKYLIYFDQLHHNLCFFKNIRTERWWMEVPSLSDEENNEIISCTQEDYVKAAEQEIPDRWWKTYQRIN
jgi:arginase family enzyme